MEPNAIGQTGFYIEHRIGLLVLSLGLLLAVLELVRRGHLKERYALLWISTALGVVLIGLFPNILARLSNWFGFQYLTTVFVLSFLFLLVLVLVFSIIISKLSERNRTLAQEVALLDARVRALEREGR